MIHGIWKLNMPNFTIYTMPSYVAAKTNAILQSVARKRKGILILPSNFDAGLKEGANEIVAMIGPNGIGARK